MKFGGYSKKIYKCKNISCVQRYFQTVFFIRLQVYLILWLGQWGYRHDHSFRKKYWFWLSARFFVYFGENGKVGAGIVGVGVGVWSIEGDACIAPTVGTKINNMIDIHYRALRYFCGQSESIWICKCIFREKTTSPV